MAKRLRDKDVAAYEREGYLFPLNVLGAAEVADLRGRLEAFEAENGGPLQGAQRSKSYLLFKWVDDLMRDPRILDPVEDLIGPDILCWNSIFWIKEAGSPNFVSWHQDLNYWGLDAKDLVTAWLALSPAAPENGCMRVLPGSHRGAALPHKDTFHGDNMLTRGQEIAREVSEAETVTMALSPGQMSLHNVRLAHASGPNSGADRRIGLSFHYMPTRSRQLIGAWDSAALVRGEDRFGHFALAPRPARDGDPATRTFHEKAVAALHEILFKDAAQDSDRIG
ncbi:MAG TPA: phytanoyl-CoA dioxygenase family protein [Kiloniellaceae bacterium]|nr:phytanoyl-CoA dioxygenase family protein [Kiloniellaceae bacterium]